VFGIFGKMYIKEDPEGDAGIKRMKAGVWVDLTNMLLWLIAALVKLFWFLKARSSRTTFTGRADV